MSNDGIKNPNNEAQNPAPMPEGDRSKPASHPQPRDPEGQQGSTQPGKDHTR